MRMEPFYDLESTGPRLMGQGTAWIAPNATLIGDIRLHDDVSIWFGAVLRGDDDAIEIGRGSNIQDNAVLHVDPGYPISIGEDCTIGHRAMIHGCTIGEGSLIGMGATVLNGAKIGRGCLIGAGALITEGKEIPDHSLAVGSPAKVVRKIDADGLADLRRAAEAYRLRWKRFRDGLQGRDRAEDGTLSREDPA